MPSGNTYNFQFEPCQSSYKPFFFRCVFKFPLVVKGVLHSMQKYFFSGRPLFFFLSFLMGDGSSISLPFLFLSCISSLVVVVTDKALSLGQEIFGHIFLAHSWGSGKVSLILFTQQFGNIILFFSNLPMLALFLHCKDPLFISKQNVALYAIYL